MPVYLHEETIDGARTGPKDVVEPCSRDQTKTGRREPESWSYGIRQLLTRWGVVDRDNGYIVPCDHFEKYAGSRTLIRIPISIGRSVDRRP